MGIAIIWVFLFHSDIQLYCNEPFKSIFKSGNFGVDFFFVLSGFGCCFSLSKNRIGKFLKNRLLRILPCYLAVLFLVHAAGIVAEHFEMEINHPHTWFETLCWYTGVGYWLNGCYYEWYVPTLMLFYLILPFFFKCKIKALICILAFSLIIVTYCYFNDVCDQWFISYRRIISYLGGVAAFKYYSVSENLANRKLLFIFYWIFIVLSFLICFYFHMPQSITFSVAAPIVLITLAHIFSHLKGSFPYRFFVFVGGISLELYLIHLYHRPWAVVGHIIANPFIQTFVVFLLCLLLSFIIQKTLNKFSLLITKGLHTATS